MTVPGAWALYDLQEQELWNAYAVTATYLAGKEYILGERLIRRRMLRSVERLRYQTANVKVPDVVA